MTDQQPDSGAMASAYLDLWQQQLQQMMQDPQQIDLWQKLTAQHMQQFFATFANDQGYNMPSFAAKAAGNDTTPPPSHRPATAAAASDRSAGGMAELAHRLAAVESRLADLEARLYNTSG